MRGIVSPCYGLWDERWEELPATFVSFDPELGVWGIGRSCKPGTTRLSIDVSIYVILRDEHLEIELAIIVDTLSLLDPICVVT